MNDSEDKPSTDLALYGHPLSSYTWKVLIALYAEGTPFDFRIIDQDHPEHREFAKQASPLGKFPVLSDKENVLFEATSIIEYLSRHYGGNEMILPTDPDAAIGMRMLDRVFDNYVMTPMQAVVKEQLSGSPDDARIADARDKLDRTYAWLEGWLQYYPPLEHITLIECAASPALFYARKAHDFTAQHPRLARWFEHLKTLEPVAACIEGARPYFGNFPLGDPSAD